MKEQQLIDGCRRGESWARKELYEIYAPLMMSVCMRYVNNRETARDLLQDGFIKVFTKFGEYAGRGALGAWMRRVFVTTALEYLRTTDALKLSVHIDDAAIHPVQTDESALDRLSTEELMQCVAQLPDGYRTVFNMYAIEGFSHKEIAQILGVSEITSRTQFIRARNALQKSVLSLIDKDHVRQSKT
ncbi:sigma-70 family RNA polymerase sigma factor [Parabacteroides sp. OttesenSCG-928-B22]|nr:sigma-70 family RNA polymerase sigma factor [Parabacteroides sp. OttesenSCG-928-B22]